MSDRPPDSRLGAIASERSRLVNLAYRLLRSLAEAEDAVQETYARWYAMSPAQQEAIKSPGAWLMTVASRICLDQLGSARARRERYVGAWIPEPLPQRTSGARRRHAVSWPPPRVVAFAPPMPRAVRPTHTPSWWTPSCRRGKPATSRRSVNGLPGLVAQQNGAVVTVYAFEVRGDRITHIWVVRNPNKLRPWT